MPWHMPFRFSSLMTSNKGSYLSCGGLCAALLTARAEMAGSCCKFADTRVEVGLGREIGSFVCGRVDGSSIMIIDVLDVFRQFCLFLFDEIL